MEWIYLTYTIPFLFLSYLIGSLNFSLVISKWILKKDIRTEGSGNAGATNITRSYGKKIGLVVLILDILKVVVAVGIAWAFKKSFIILNDIIIQFIFIAVLLGHFFPIFFKFKGGKGAACYAGMIFCIDWTLFILGIIIFALVVLTSKKASLASIISISLTCGLTIGLRAIYLGNDIDMVWLLPFTKDDHLWLIATVSSIIVILVLAKHHQNIYRLIKKEENTFEKNKTKK